MIYDTQQAKSCIYMFSCVKWTLQHYCYLMPNRNSEWINKDLFISTVLFTMYTLYEIVWRTKTANSGINLQRKSCYLQALRRQINICRSWNKFQSQCDMHVLFIQVQIIIRFPSFLKEVVLWVSRKRGTEPSLSPGNKQSYQVTQTPYGDGETTQSW